jgi:hypothetical protein
MYLTRNSEVLRFLAERKNAVGKYLRGAGSSLDGLLNPPNQFKGTTACSSGTKFKSVQ